MNGFIKAKKIQVKQVVIVGVTIDMRIKWSATYQEYTCSVKLSGERHYSYDNTYYTSDFDDAVNSVRSMAGDLAVRTVQGNEATYLVMM